ncbi:uncharacterized protein EDB91DRAFT_504421 [Suillus paluster]|uniref:uncharacterized protein n=1 Tax=Suillus paluster TaxID=48578 RepID=UPI001B886390|nr:uncharacterized protein EDB91DRAFT_504421 [Suillus paluster]KAG1736402.1 hypothetical protein EDB91DRAFT_504421 [Suillus paluster]
MRHTSINVLTKSALTINTSQIQLRKKYMVAGFHTCEAQLGRTSRRKFGNQSRKGRQGFSPITHNCPISILSACRRSKNCAAARAVAQALAVEVTEEEVSLGAETRSRIRGRTAVRSRLVDRKENTTDGGLHWMKSAVIRQGNEGIVPSIAKQQSG